MKTLACAVVLMLAALPLRAEEAVFDLGFARPGMEQAQFRSTPWGAGVRVWCSNDEDRPDQVVIAMPKGAARSGAARCGLYQQGEGGDWSPKPLDLAGWPGEVCAIFLPDASGVSRLAQLSLALPEQAFNDLARWWDQIFGLPTLRRGRLVHWSTQGSDAGWANCPRTIRASVLIKRFLASMDGLP